MDVDAVTRLLSPAQIRSVVESQARINIWHGAIRSGKTIASLLRWLIYVATAPAGGRLVVVGRTKDTIARNVFEPLMDPAIFGPVAAQVRYTRGAATAVILGRVVEVIGAHDERSEGRLRGMTCAGAYVDEATLVPRSFWVQLLGRLSVTGSKLFGTTNPDNPGHWLRKEFLLRANALNLAHWHFGIDDNPALDPKIVSDMKAEFTGLWYRRFIEGAWVQSAGAVYDMWDEGVHVVDTLPPVLRWIGTGVDYGTINPFAALALAVGQDPGDGKRRLYLAREWRYDSKLERRQLTDAEYSQRLRTWLLDERIDPDWVCVDPSAASFITQLFQDDLPARKANNAVLDGIRNVSSLLATDRLRVHRSCTGWIDEVGGYSWDDDKAEKGEDAPIKANDHSLDAGRYVIRTTRNTWRSELLEDADAAA